MGCFFFFFFFAKLGSKTWTNQEVMENQLFVIDGYRIWAKTHEEAYESYLRIIKL